MSCPGHYCARCDDACYDENVGCRRCENRSEREIFRLRSLIGKWVKAEDEWDAEYAADDRSDFRKESYYSARERALAAAEVLKREAAR